MECIGNMNNVVRIMILKSDKYIVKKEEKLVKRILKLLKLWDIMGFNRDRSAGRFLI